MSKAPNKIYHFPYPMLIYHYNDLHDLNNHHEHMTKGTVTPFSLRRPSPTTIIIFINIFTIIITTTIIIIFNINIIMNMPKVHTLLPTSSLSQQTVFTCAMLIPGTQVLHIFKFKCNKFASKGYLSPTNINVKC